MLELARGEQVMDVPHTDIIEQTTFVINELIQVHPSTNIKHIVPIQEKIDILISANAYQQIIRNLLINAIRYSRDTPEITISYEKTRSKIKVHVSDRGIGIPAQHIDKIFDRFYRVDMARSRDIGGSGLGLSIVKMLIENANGSIYVTSELEKGSIFTIVLPTENGTID